MTESQIMINELKTKVEQALNLVSRLEKASKDLEKLKVPSFPPRFIAVEDSAERSRFVIGLRDDSIQHWSELPPDFKGRALFDEEDIRQIITGLQTLLGDK